MGMPTDPPLMLAVDGVEHQVRHAHASWWIRHLSGGDWFSLITQAVPALMDRMWDDQDPFDMDSAARLAIQLTEGVTGMPWPRAVRLAATADARWDRLETWAIANAGGGFDLMTAPPRRTLAAVQAMLFATCEKEAEAETLMRKLDDPIGIPGYSRSARRQAFTMSPEEIAAMQEPTPVLARTGR